MNDYKKIIKRGQALPVSTSTYYTDCFHVSPRRLLTAAAMLNTMDVNQNPLTASAAPVPTFWYEYCKVVAVTAEKTVATVERFTKLLAPCCCAKRIVGIPVPQFKGQFRGNTKTTWIWPPTNFDEHGQCRADRVKMFAHIYHQLVQVSPNRRGLKLAFVMANISVAPSQG